MLERYFRGSGGSYALSPSERAAAQDYIQANINDGYIVGGVRGSRNGRHSRQVNFAYWDPLAGYSGEPMLDGLLGSPTVDFDGNAPIRLRDRYDFEPRRRGWPIEAVTSYLRNSARTFCRNPTPISIEADLRGGR